VPVSRLNQLRRQTIDALESALRGRLTDHVARVCEQVEAPVVKRSPTDTIRWSIKVDRIGVLDALEVPDLEGLDEIIIDIARDQGALLAEKLGALAGRVGEGKIRLALPALTRSWEDKGLRQKIGQLRAAGWRK